MKFIILISFIISSTALADILPENTDIEFKSGNASVVKAARGLYKQETDGGIRKIERLDGSFYMRATNTNIDEPRVSFVKQSGRNIFEIATRNLKPGGDLERTVECSLSTYRKDRSILIYVRDKKPQYDCYYASANTCRKLFSGMALYKADFNQCKNLAEKFRHITGYSDVSFPSGGQSYRLALAREMNRLNTFIQDVPVVDRDQLEAALSLENINEKQPNAIKYFHDLDRKVELCMKHFPEQAFKETLQQIEKNNSKRADQ